MLEQEGPKHSVVSVDKTKGEMSENKAVCDKLLAVAKDMTENLKCGLSATLIVSVGLPYMVTKDVDKEDGLVNGAVGVLIDMSYLKSEIAVLWLSFDDKNIGVSARNGSKDNFRRFVSERLTPIFKIVRSFRVVNKCSQLGHLMVERLQFPLVQASALTIHKYQGKTSHQGLATDFESHAAVESMHYTGLSRCPNELGNYIVTSLHAHQNKANLKAKRDMVRLRKDANMIFALPFENLENAAFICLFHEVESFRKSFYVIENLRFYKYCSVLVFAETRLLPEDLDSYIIPGYKQFRFDWPSSYRIPAGLIL